MEPSCDQVVDAGDVCLDGPSLLATSPTFSREKTRVLKRRRGRMEAFLVAAQVLLEDSGRIGIWSPKTQIIRIENVCNFFTT